MFENLRALREEYNNALKTVLKENISRNPLTLNTNKIRIVNAYNNLILEIRTLSPLVNDADKAVLKELFVKCKDRLRRAFVVLNCDYCVPDDIHSLVVPEIRDSSIIQDTSDNGLESSTDNLDISSHTDNSQSIKTNLSNINITEMANLSPVEFLRLCSSTINRNFNGDPLSLQSFIDSVDLLKTLATDQNLINILIKFVLSKLEGKARESVTPNPITVEAIINELKGKIKYENSKVIEGRMQALRADRVKLQEFSQKADELADCFQRALIMEGIPVEKAQEMTVDKTVEMCRASARSDLAKAVLASSSFKDPKEVVAKFLIEINSENKERQVLTFKASQNKTFQRNYNVNSRGRNPNFRPNFSSNRRNFNFNRPQNNNRNFVQNYQNRAGNNSQSFNNYRPVNRNQYQQNQYRNQNVRYLENLNAPQWHQGHPRLGAENQDQPHHQQ